MFTYQRLHPMSIQEAFNIGPSGFAWFKPHTRYIVIYGTGTKQDGYWYERAEMFRWPRHPYDGPSLTLEPTGRYERRDDGYLAEIFEPGC